jgi:hypothetical protein
MQSFAAFAFFVLLASSVVAFFMGALGPGIGLGLLAWVAISISEAS